MTAPLSSPQLFDKGACLPQPLNLIPVPLGRKKDPFCLYIRKPRTQKVKGIPKTDLVSMTEYVVIEAPVCARCHIRALFLLNPKP